MFNSASVADTTPTTVFTAAASETENGPVVVIVGAVFSAISIKFIVIVSESVAIGVPLSATCTTSVKLGVASKFNKLAFVTLITPVKALIVNAPAPVPPVIL